VIRVVYRWHVEAATESAFVAWWHEGTLGIRASQPGAMGSTLCRSIKDPGQLVGIARWESRAHLEAFWGGAGAVEFPGATLEDVEIFDELDHLTMGEP
jgi:heme-degrading monooxygenase HmoA